MARLAKSLEKLRSQVNSAYPKRSKLSDGWIGDAAHQAVASDHNPNRAGVVTALDLTHDPKNGFDAHTLADVLIANRHPNLEYVISNRRIAGAWTNWKWQRYTGSNPHDKHIHVSVGDGKPDGQATGNYDSTKEWALTKGGSVDNKKPVGHARANQIFKAVLLRGMTAAEFNKYHKGKTELQLFEQARTSNEHKQLVTKRANDEKQAAKVPALEKQVYTLTKTLEEANKEIDRLSKLNPSDPNSVTISKDGLWAVITNLFKKG